MYELDNKPAITEYTDYTGKNSQIEIKKLKTLKSKQNHPGGGCCNSNPSCQIFWI